MSWRFLKHSHFRSFQQQKIEREREGLLCVCHKCDLESGQSWLWSATSWSCCRLTGACYLTWRPPECQRIVLGSMLGSTLYCLFCRILRWNWESMSTMECLWCLWVPCGCNFGLKWAEQLQYTLDIRVSRMPLDRRQGVILTTYYILQDHETTAGNPKDWRFQVMIRPDPCSIDMFVPSWFFRTKAIQSHKK